MAYSELFTRSCSTGGPNYTFSRNYCSTSYYNTKTDYCTNSCTNTGYDNHYDSYYTNGCSNHNDKYMDYSVYAETYSSKYIDYKDGCNDCGEDSYNDYGEVCKTYYETVPETNCSQCYDDCIDSGYNNACYTCSNSGYDNHSDTYNNNYDNTCRTLYYDKITWCTTQWYYTNYADASHSSTGGSMTLSWTSLTDSSSESDGGQQGANITSGSIKELKDNLDTLLSKKGRNKVSSFSIGGMKRFDRAFFLNDHSDGGISKIKSTLQDLWNDLKGSGELPSLPNTASDSVIKAASLKELKDTMNTLAEASISYANYLNASYSNSSRAEYNTLYIDNVTGSTPAASYTNYKDVRNADDVRVKKYEDTV